MTSVLNVDTVADKAGTGPVSLTKQEALKSWCLWELDGTQAVTTSLNISSIADNGTGFTTQTFTNNFSNGDYSPTYNGVHDAGSYTCWGTTAHDQPPTSSTLRVDFITNNAAAADAELASSHVVGDLA